MTQKISHRLLQIINALPLSQGIRILEIGCGPGVAAREIANRIDFGFILAIDRSAKAIEQAMSNSQSEINSGKLKFVHARIEELVWHNTEEPFDIAFAIRVGALDGRHPEMEQAALRNIRRCLKKDGKLFIDGGNPLLDISHKLNF